ncbi:MAG: hypothetical protein EOO13_18165 [Chitinophagaceae bacterium]|nr:MAG: hypothetical protein EOO13_18165 [Chitinophagaceae bacterium]
MVGFFGHIIRFLNDEQIPYMLSGSMAMSLYTVARSTQDFDFIVELRHEDIPKIVSYFGKGYYCDEDAILDAVKRKSMFNILEQATSFKADFMLLKDDEYRQTEFARRVPVTMMGLETWVVAGEDLLLSKLIWIQQLQSGRQMEDIKAISKYPDLDWAYIDHWIHKLNLNTFGLLETK